MMKMAVVVVVIWKNFPDKQVNLKHFEFNVNQC